jgi:meiotic recombination protein SPO11
VFALAGLLFGDLHLSHLDDVIDCKQHQFNGISIPSEIQDMKVLSSLSRFILIVEKEASFQRLLEDRFCDKFGPCIILTGRGFPDINTRRFLQFIQMSLEIPVLALVDCDPFGFEILSVFKFGSHVCHFNFRTVALCHMSTNHLYFHSEMSIYHPLKA